MRQASKLLVITAINVGFALVVLDFNWWQASLFSAVLLISFVIATRERPPKDVSEYIRINPKGNTCMKRLLALYVCCIGLTIGIVKLANILFGVKLVWLYPVVVAMVTLFVVWRVKIQDRKK